MTAAPDSLAWLDQVPESDHDRIAAILDEYLADAERGMAPAIDEFVARYPEWSEPLRGALQSLQAVNRVVAAFPATHREGPWPQLGDYQIVRELGRGGMGIVYEARQLSLGRTVALKVLPFAAVLEPTHVQRFQNEAQAAAQLHHPHIVPVFAVGCERGVHFYSMQYIDGQSLDQAIRQLRDWRPPVATASGATGDQPTSPDFDAVPAPRVVSVESPVVRVSAETLAPSSPTPTTLSPTTKVACGLSTQGSIHRSAYVKSVVELMIQAADALHYAHESGVVHRDIKPSNLLIDRRGKLSVADFGLARCQSLANLTTHGGLCGTVRYMSPEQAGGRSALVDLRTDVYGLGVTLYEMLTLRTPFEADDRELLLRQIQTEEPPAPRRFNRAVAADLETIILKAMAKSRDERYESADAFAGDLRRFLAGQPTLARRPTAWDRAGKWIARRAKGVAISLVALAATLVAFGLFSAMLAREQRHTGIALAEAELHLRAARLAVDDFCSDLSEQLAVVPGAEPVRLAALERAERFYAEFERYASDDPRWRQDLAIASIKRVFVLERMGRIDEADTAYRRAVERLDRSSASKEVTAEWLAESAMGRAHAGQFWVRRQRWREGLDALETAYHDIQTALTLTTDEVVYRDDLARIEGALGEALCDRGERAQGRRLLESAVATMRRLQGMERVAGDRHDELSQSGERRETRLAVTLRRLAERTQNIDQAARYYEESLELQRRRLARRPDSQVEITELASTLNGYASRIAEEDPRKAAELFGEARRLLEQAVRLSPDDFRLRRDWAVALHNEGMAVDSLGDSNRSLGLLDDAIREQTAAYEASGYDPEYQSQLQQYEKHRERIREIRNRPDGSVWIDRLGGTTI